MILLQPTLLHWIKDEGDDPYDLCAHSPVDFRVDDEVLIRPEDGDWTVSAAALRLLRTLERDHAPGASGRQLFPCCGQVTCQEPGEREVLILGCGIGADFAVLHKGGDIQIKDATGRCLTVTSDEWQRAVFGFADAVEEFYKVSAPKQPCSPEDEQAYPLFWQELKRRRNPD